MGYSRWTDDSVESKKVESFLDLLFTQCQTISDGYYSIEDPQTLAHVHHVAYEAALAEAQQLAPDAVKRHRGRIDEKGNLAPQEASSVIA
ncbi:MAG: hypothetical protein WCG28_02920 [bacterium]